MVGCAIIAVICSISIVVIPFVVSYSKRRHRARVTTALIDVFRQTQIIYEDSVVHGTFNNNDAFRNAINNHALWLQSKLSGLISPLEIEVVLNGPQGPRLWLSSGSDREYRSLQNYIFYMQDRLSSVMRRYGELS